MLKTLQLLAPALIPSWNFFDVVAPSPRIEFALAAAPDDLTSGAPDLAWREFRPKPEHVPLALMARRLIWNPCWNETLFVVSCAERLVDQPTAHSQDEIFRRIARDLSRQPDTDVLPPWLGFRLVFVAREDETIVRETLFVAEPRLRADISVR